MNDREYNALPGLRRSDLWYMNTTPMHFKYHMEHGEEPTRALSFGQAAHKYMLERETFWEEFAVIPNVDRRTKAGKEDYKAFTEANADKTWISEDEFDTIAGMSAELFRDPYYADIMSAGEHEVTYLWTDSETGVPLKCKADIVDNVNRIIYDYKTTTSCADGLFERDARRYGYDFQVGFYTSGIEAEELERYGFGFIVQEKTAPYAVRLYICDRGFIASGKNKFRRILNQYAECAKNDEWPGYIEETLYAEEY